MTSNKKAICWLSTAHGITDIYSGFLTPLMPFLAAKIGFSLALATFITSVSQALASSIQPLFGYWADTHKNRTFIFWGLLISALTIPLAANANNFWVLFLLVILGNLGGSLFHPQALSFIPQFSDKNAVFNMSLFITAGTFGFALGPIISSFIVQFFGYEKLLLTPIVGFITALLMFNFVPKINFSNFCTKHKNFIEALGDICSSKLMQILLIIGLMKTLIQSSCSIMMPFLWKDLGYSPIYIGFSMFLFLFAGGLGSLSSHWFEKKLGAKFVFYASMTITLPLMILYNCIYKTTPIFALVIFVIIGFLTAFAQPITLVMAQKMLPQYKGIISGIINGFTWGIVAIMLICFGFAAEKIGIMQILIILSILPAISSLLVKYLPEKVEE